jgi:hypothetical protein
MEQSSQRSQSLLRFPNKGSTLGITLAAPGEKVRFGNTFGSAEGSGSPYEFLWQVWTPKSKCLRL